MVKLKTSTVDSIQIVLLLSKKIIITRELSGRVLDSIPNGHGFERHCVVSLSKTD